MKKMLSIKETALETGLTESSIRTGINKGIFPAFRIGDGKRSKFIIDIDEFQRILKELALSNIKKPLPANNPKNTNSSYKDIIEIKEFRKFKES